MAKFSKKGAFGALWAMKKIAERHARNSEEGEELYSDDNYLEDENYADDDHDYDSYGSDYDDRASDYDSYGADDRY